MMIPILDGVRSPLRAPVTYCLIFMNILVYFFVDVYCHTYDERIDQILQNSQFNMAQGQIYAQFVIRSQKESKHHFENFVLQLAKRSVAGDSSATSVLANQFAIQDVNFIREAPLMSWVGDQVAIPVWKSRLAELQELRAEHPLYQLGLVSTNRSFVQAITYQFAHSGLSHLLFNMFFLLLFGSLLEPILGSMAYVLIYLAGGLFAAVAFSWGAGESAAPLVGASGSIGALIGASLITSGKQEQKFFAYVGFFKMPFWIWFFYFWLLVDLTGFLKNLPGMSLSVAHSAHIGGSLAGLVLTFCYVRWVSYSKIPAQVSFIEKPQ